jgi:osmotically-inducible protein OsmY
MLWSRVFIIVSLMFLLSGCVSQIWTGISLAYDRHSVYKKITDYGLASKATRLVFQDKLFSTQGSVVDIAVFNHDVLLAGHVPTPALKQILEDRIARLRHFRHLYNEVEVKRAPDQTMMDTWITTKIRSSIFADASIDPNAFKVVTTDGVVYIMGEVRPEEARRVIQIARNAQGVQRVVTLLVYFQLMASK